MSQSDLVTSWFWFAIVFILLLLASFVTSVMEAALTSASKQAKIQIAMRRLKKRAIVERNELLHAVQQDNVEVLGRSNRSNVRALERRSARLSMMAHVVSEEGRGVSVGAFASLTLFLNIALAAFLPFVLIEASEANLKGVVGLDLPLVGLASEGGIRVDTWFLDLTGTKLFVFVATAIPLLLLGKIIPKEIGSRHYRFFALRWNCFARFVVRVLGWLPAGALWIVDLVSDSPGSR